MGWDGMGMGNGIDMKCYDDVNDGIEGVITRSREDDRGHSKPCPTRSGVLLETCPTQDLWK